MAGSVAESVMETRGIALCQVLRLPAGKKWWYSDPS